MCFGDNGIHYKQACEWVSLSLTLSGEQRVVYVKETGNITGIIKRDIKISELSEKPDIPILLANGQTERITWWRRRYLRIHIPDMSRLDVILELARFDIVDKMDEQPMRLLTRGDIDRFKGLGYTDPEMWHQLQTADWVRWEENLCNDHIDKIKGLAHKQATHPLEYYMMLWCKRRYDQRKKIENDENNEKPVAGDRFTVLEEFTMGFTTLRAGQQGKIHRITNNGDVVIDFDGMRQRKTIYKKYFNKLEKLQDEVEDGWDVVEEKVDDMDAPPTLQVGTVCGQCNGLGHLNDARWMMPHTICPTCNGTKVARDTKATPKPTPQFVVGDVVEAKYKGKWYGAVVSKKCSDGKFGLTWDDNTTSAVLAGEIREKAAPPNGYNPFFEENKPTNKLIFIATAEPVTDQKTTLTEGDRVLINCKNKDHPRDKTTGVVYEGKNSKGLYKIKMDTDGKLWWWNRQELLLQSDDDGFKRGWVCTSRRCRKHNELSNDWCDALGCGAPRPTNRIEAPDGQILADFTIYESEVVAPLAIFRCTICGCQRNRDGCMSCVAASYETEPTIHIPRAVPQDGGHDDNDDLRMVMEMSRREAEDRDQLRLVMVLSQSQTTERWTCDRCKCAVCICYL